MENQKSEIFMIGSGALLEIYRFLDWRSKIQISITCKKFQYLFREFGNRNRNLKMLFENSLYFELSVFDPVEFTISELYEIFRAQLYEKLEDPYCPSFIQKLLRNACFRKSENPDDTTLINIMNYIFTESGDFLITQEILNNHVYLNIIIFLCIFSGKFEVFKVLLEFENLNYSDNVMHFIFQTVITILSIKKYSKTGDTSYIDFLIEIKYNGCYHPKIIQEISDMFIKRKKHIEAMDFIKDCINASPDYEYLDALQYDETLSSKVIRSIS